VTFVLSRMNFFFGCGWGMNPRPCIFYALSLPTELILGGLSRMNLIINKKILV